jgi:hypothetical protein
MSDVGIAALESIDATGDETLWVFRYLRYFCSVTGCAMPDAFGEANAAYEAWGQDPSCTPEEIASSDIACIREDQSHAD